MRRKFCPWPEAGHADDLAEVVDHLAEASPPSVLSEAALGLV